MKTLTLDGFTITIDDVGELSRVTVSHEETEIHQQVLQGLNGILAFQFTSDDQLWSTLVTKNAKNAALVQQGALRAVTGWSPDFRKALSRALATKPGPLGWLAATVVWNALQGLFFSWAFVFGFFSSLAPVPIALGAVALFTISLSIDLNRDKKLASRIRDAWE